MATLPQIGNDPFAAAKEYNRDMTVLGSRNEENAQNALMSMFREEAARQRPWTELPVALAKQNNRFANALSNAEQLARFKQSIKPAMAPNKIGTLVTSMAKTYGLDPDTMLTIAGMESSFNSNARNKSGASGLWQFMPQTAAQYGLTDPTDVQTSTQAAMLHARHNAAALEQAGIKVDAGTMYLAWQQGAAGAIKLLKNPNVPAEQLIGRAAVIQNGGRPGMSAGQFAKLWTTKAQRNYDKRVALRHRSNQDNTTIADITQAFKDAGVVPDTMKAPDGKDVTITEDKDAS